MVVIYDVPKVSFSKPKSQSKRGGTRRIIPSKTVTPSSEGGADLVDFRTQGDFSATSAPHPAPCVRRPCRRSSPALWPGSCRSCGSLGPRLTALRRFPTLRHIAAVEQQAAVSVEDDRAVRRQAPAPAGDLQRALVVELAQAQARLLRSIGFLARTRSICRYCWTAWSYFCSARLRSAR